jgi:hypothetical protein
VTRNSIRPSYFDEALTLAAKMGHLPIAFKIIQHIGTIKTPLRSWDVLVPILQLATGQNQLEQCVLSLNTLFFDLDSNHNRQQYPAARSQEVVFPIPHTFICELLAKCSAAGLSTHAFWYHKYMMHKSLPRPFKVFKDLIHCIEMNPHTNSDEILPLIRDISICKYKVLKAEKEILSTSLSNSKNVEASQSAQALLDSLEVSSIGSDLNDTTDPHRIVVLVKEKESSSSNKISSSKPLSTFESLMASQKWEECVDILEQVLVDSPELAGSLSEENIKHLILTACTMPRIQACETLVHALRKSLRLKPSRLFIHNMLQELEKFDSQDDLLPLSVSLFGWGVISNMLVLH